MIYFHGCFQTKLLFVFLCLLYVFFTLQLQFRFCLSFVLLLFTFQTFNISLYIQLGLLYLIYLLKKLSNIQMYFVQLCFFITVDFLYFYFNDKKTAFLINLYFCFLKWNYKCLVSVCTLKMVYSV